MFNGCAYALQLEHLWQKIHTPRDAQLTSEQHVDLKSLWESVQFHELLVPCLDHHSAASEHQCSCLESLASPHLTFLHNSQMLSVPLMEVHHPSLITDFSLFSLEMQYYKAQSLVEPQLILYMEALTGRLAAARITPPTMRDIYNAFKNLLKTCAYKAHDLHHVFAHYSKYADTCIGHLCRAWIFMQCITGDEERSKFQAYTLLNQIKLDSSRSPKQTAFIYFSLGRLQRSNGEAINLYTKAIDLDPINTCIYNNRASRYKQTSPELSIQDYTAAIELDPTDPHLYYNRAILYRKYMQDSEQACRDFTKSLELSPGNVNALYFRALLYHMHLNEYEKALADYTQVIQMATDCRMLVKAYYSRGSLYTLNLDQPAAALDDFNSALKLNPQYDNARFNKKMLLVKLRKFSCVGNV